MFIKSLMLVNYRNYKDLNLEFGKNVNVFMGDNAQGKTNVLESIYYCSFAKSHRTSRDKELIAWDSSDAYISINVGKDRLDKKIDINILKDGKKAIKINKIKINKIGELFGTFNVVMFSPEDLKIIKDSPGVRRRFIDMEICQLNSQYYYNLVQYNKVINQRNIVLKAKNYSDDILDIYDEQLSVYGEYIVKKRVEYIDKLNYYGKNIHRDITSKKESIEFIYQTNIKNKKQFLALLNKNRKKDFERGMTTIGPHRDDFSVFINGIDTKNYGSQGQQRTAVLTIKFSSLRIIKEITNEYPILLLDDVLSELDFNRKKYILSTIGEIQTIITCTETDDIKDYLDKKSKIFYVKEGKLLD